MKFFFWLVSYKYVAMFKDKIKLKYNIFVYFHHIGRL